MKRKKKIAKERNWPLVFICAILIALGGTLVALAIVNIPQLGWWSLAIGGAGLTTTIAAILSIVKNDPSLILLDLILQR